MAILSAAFVFMIFPGLEKLGLLGANAKQHDHEMVYLTISDGVMAIEYPFANIQECQMHRSALVSRFYHVTLCRTGAELNATK